MYITEKVLPLAFILPQWSYIQHGDKSTISMKYQYILDIGFTTI